MTCFDTMTQEHRSVLFKQNKDSSDKLLKAKEGAVQGVVVFVPLALVIGVFLLLFDFPLVVVITVSSAVLIFGLAWAVLSSNKAT